MRQKIKWLAWFGVLGLLIYTRFLNLAWGLPFPFHPDERNMAVAIQQLQCASPYDLSTCFNPHFFAYGQLSLYLGYLVVWLSRVISHLQGEIRFDEAVLGLRFLSFIAAIGTALAMKNIIHYSRLRLQDVSHLHRSVMVSFLSQIVIAVGVIFSPVLIQFSHFGTTESILMMLYTWLVYRCLLLEQRRNDDDFSLVWIGGIVGLAIAVKVSSISFLLLPFLCTASLARRSRNESRYEHVWQILNEWVFMVFVAGVVALLGSPHNRISWADFVGSMQYESAVATGTIKVFYTWTFEFSKPLIFQLQSIFPYALGLPMFLLFVLSFFALPSTWKNNVLRLSVLFFFVLWSFAYTKWTRFMAPLFPVMISIGLLQVVNMMESAHVRAHRSIVQVLLGIGLCGVLIYPGLRFLQVYQQEDVRIRASRWMQQHIPAGSTILQETANVVDLPLVPLTVTNISFNFYELDQVPTRATELKRALAQSDYIIIPSRRIVSNYWCDPRELSSTDRAMRSRCSKLRARFPKLNQYYDDLFSDHSRFKKIVEFSTLDDESAEETWTVFDHPVIRIYKRI